MTDLDEQMVERRDMQQRRPGTVTHGMSKSPTYVSWYAMITRCTNRNGSNYRLYGGRGITVCERWRTSFASFLSDMGARPPGTTLDRIDNSQGYSPTNCRWSTRSQQARNMRVRRSNTSGVKGVRFRPDHNSWTAEISVGQRTIHLGSFQNMDDAIRARREGETMYWSSERPEGKA